VRLFSDETIRDLEQRSPAAMFRIYNAALQLYRIGDQEVKRAEGIRARPLIRYCITLRGGWACR
jgi:hypothetical protein